MGIADAERQLLFAIQSILPVYRFILWDCKSGFKSYVLIYSDRKRKKLVILFITKCNSKLVITLTHYIRLVTTIKIR